MTKEPSVQFHALPGHQALCHSWCGYMVLSLPALGLDVCTDQVELITVDGIEREMRPMCKDTLMMIPSLGHQLRAQVVRVYLKGQEETKPFKTIRAGVAPPDHSYGLTAAHNRYERHSR